MLCPTFSLSLSDLVSKKTSDCCNRHACHVMLYCTIPHLFHPVIMIPIRMIPSLRLGHSGSLIKRIVVDPSLSVGYQCIFSPLTVNDGIVPIDLNIIISKNHEYIYCRPLPFRSGPHLDGYHPCIGFHSALYPLKPNSPEWPTPRPAVRDQIVVNKTNTAM